MARITVEDCLKQVPNRFALIVLASERARQLAHGAKPLVECNNKAAVTSLREIAQGSVRFNESIEGTLRAYIAEMAVRNGERSPRRRGPRSGGAT